MVRKCVVLTVIAIFCVAVYGGTATAVDKNKKTEAVKQAAPAAAKQAVPATAAQKAPAATPGTMRPPAMPTKGSFSMIGGKVSKIDNSDPSNVKIELKNEADNTVHVVSVTPATNVTKVTDISELKTGEAIRVMCRKVDDKEVAMGVLFGNIKSMPPPRPVGAMPPPVPTKPEAPPTTAKEVKKK